MHSRILSSSGFRLALRYMALFGISVAILLGFLYWATLGYMARQTEHTIEAEIQGLSEQYFQRGFLGLTGLVAQRVAADSDKTALYLLTDSNFVPIAGNLGRWPEISTRDGPWLGLKIPDGEATRSYRARHFELQGGFHLLVGRDTGELDSVRELIIRALVGGTVLTTVLALVGGLLMSRSMVRRIESINETSRDIMRGDLSRRVPTDGSGDEFDELAGNLNRMLEEIQTLMVEVKRASDNIAHDLRTPLSRLSLQLESMRVETDTTEELQHKIAVASDSAQDLIRTFNALLRIARVESQASRDQFAPVNLETLIDDVCELYEPVCAARNQSLERQCPTGLDLFADRDLLFQSLVNLLDNAVKYAPSDSTIGVFATVSEHAIAIGVADRGPGIPTERHTAVVKRFIRLESSRSTPGNGLGLSLVRAVAQLHEAGLHFSDNHPGLVVQMLFPKAGAALPGETAAAPALQLVS